MDLQGICEATLWNNERKSICMSLHPLTPEWVHKAFIKMKWPQQRLRVALPCTLNSISATRWFTKENPGLERRLDIYWLAGIVGACRSQLIASSWLGRGWESQWVCPAWRLSHQNKADEIKGLLTLAGVASTAVKKKMRPPCWLLTRWHHVITYAP